jgi:hypothetical protein
MVAVFGIAPKVSMPMPEATAQHKQNQWIPSPESKHWSPGTRAVAVAACAVATVSSFHLSRSSNNTFEESVTLYQNKNGTIWIVDIRSLCFGSTAKWYHLRSPL